LDNGHLRIGSDAFSQERVNRLLPIPAGMEPNPLSQPASEASFGTMRGLGRSMFGDYLFAVELAGTLLLLAAIAAIAISPKRVGGQL
jgi:NADH-quinone oxidoreductase subunit J